MEMLELAAELKWCRERIVALEAERDRLRNRIVNLEYAVRRDIAANVDLQNERDLLQAARYSYASLFSPNADGEPDVDSIHQNIRGLIAEREQLRAENARLIATLKLIADHYDASDRQIALVEAALAADGNAPATPA